MKEISKKITNIFSNFKETSSMKYERYDPAYEAHDLSIFEFISYGKHGAIKKRIHFSRTEVNGIYNLTFGNVGENDYIDDRGTIDNGDRDKILATIAQAVDQYTIRYPRRWIYFCGNTPAKTRLYRMAVGLHLELLLKNFEVFAEVDGEEEYIPFHANMKVEGFLVRRRISIVS